MTTAPKLIREQLLALADEMRRFLDGLCVLLADKQGWGVGTHEAIKNWEAQLRSLAAEPADEICDCGYVRGSLGCESIDHSPQPDSAEGDPLCATCDGEGHTFDSIPCETCDGSGVLRATDEEKDEVIAAGTCDRNCDCVGYCKAGIERYATDWGKDELFDGERRESWRDVVDAEQPRAEGNFLGDDRGHD